LKIVAFLKLSNSAFMKVKDYLQIFLKINNNVFKFNEK
tara:strand:- start:998 stop:1111 length:114 start_codon:yes stop_codon:yes gene_type:complete